MVYFQTNLFCSTKYIYFGAERIPDRIYLKKKEYCYFSFRQSRKSIQKELSSLRYAKLLGERGASIQFLGVFSPLSLPPPLLVSAKIFYLCLVINFLLHIKSITIKMYCLFTIYFPIIINHAAN